MDTDKILKYYEEELTGGQGCSKNTAIGYISDIKQFLKYINEEEIELLDVNPMVGRSYLIYCKQNNKSIETINRYRMSLGSFYAYLEDSQMIEYNPFDSVKKLQPTKSEKSKQKNDSKFKKEYLEIEEVEALKKAIKSEIAIFKNIEDCTGYKRNPMRDYAVVLIMLATGCRISEVCGLTMNNIDIKNRTLTFVDTKNGDTVTMNDLDKKAMDAVTEYLKIRDSNKAKTDHVFITRIGTPLDGRNMNEMLRYYTEKAGIKKHITNHCIRHTYATMFCRECKDPDTVKEVLRHKSLSTTELYIHEDKQREKNTIVKTGFSLI